MNEQIRERIEKLARETGLKAVVATRQDLIEVLTIALTAFAEEEQKEKANSEILIYDAMRAIQQGCGALLPLIDLYGTEKDRESYKRGMYAPCIKLQMVLGNEGIQRGDARRKAIGEKAEQYFANPPGE